MEFYGQATKAQEETIIGQEKEQIEIAYVSAAVNNLGDAVTKEGLQSELNKLLQDDLGKKTQVTNKTSDKTLYVLFYETQHKYNVNKGIVSKVNVIEDETMVAGLYDENNNLLVTWEDLVDVYNLNELGLYEILNNNPEFANGKILLIQDGVTEIASNIFSSCGELINVILPDSITSIGTSAFYNCSSLTNITIPDSVTSIGEYAFYNCSSLTNITIPNGVTSIEISTFNNCSSLTSITIPDSVTSIGKSAFQYCSNLSHIYIPSSVLTINASATGKNQSPFFGCDSTLKIYCGASTKPSGWMYNWPYYNSGESYTPTYGCTRTDYEEIISQ